MGSHISNDVLSNELGILVVEPLQKSLWLTEVGKIYTSLDPTIAGAYSTPLLEQLFSNIILPIAAPLTNWYARSQSSRYILMCKNHEISIVTTSVASDTCMSVLIPKFWRYLICELYILKSVQSYDGINERALIIVD
ncbi:MAG: hypothetical protein ABSG71_13550 [Thermodesulfobacteriota bacterium]